MSITTQVILNKKHLDKPQEGDFWHDMGHPVCIVVEVKGNNVAFCKSKIFMDMSKNIWIWNFAETLKSSLEEFRKTITLHNNSRKTFCNVIPDNFINDIATWKEHYNYQNDDSYMLTPYTVPATLMLENCPLCEAEAVLFRIGQQSKLIHEKGNYSSKLKYFVSCSYHDSIGQQDGIRTNGCVLYLPAKDFYKSSTLKAIEYWNTFSKSIKELRTFNIQKRLEKCP